jgi:endonuclease
VRLGRISKTLASVVWAATTVRLPHVRILVARCEIAYHGRATTRLGAGDRVTLFRQDGSLCVHTDNGFKPLNYNLTKARGG